MTEVLMENAHGPVPCHDSKVISIIAHITRRAGHVLYKSYGGQMIHIMIGGEMLCVGGS